MKYSGFNQTSPIQLHPTVLLEIYDISITIKWCTILYHHYNNMSCFYGKIENFYTYFVYRNSAKMSLMDIYRESTLKANIRKKRDVKNILRRKLK